MVGVEQLTASSEYIFYPFCDYQLIIFLYQTNVFIFCTVSFLIFDIMYEKDKVRLITSKNRNRGNS